MSEMPHIGDDEKLDIIPGWAVINGYEHASPDGAKIDLCIRYVEERHRGLSHEQALYSLGQTLRQWYPTSPPLWGNDGGALPVDPEQPPDPGLPFPLPDLPPELAARKIPWGRQLECGGQHFSINGDGSPRLPVGIHAGDFIGQWVTRQDRRHLLLQALDDAYAAGYSWLRCWINVDPNPWWETNGIAKSWNPITTPGFDHEYDHLLAALEVRQMQLHLAAGGLDILPRSKYHEMYAWIAQRVADRPYQYALIEAVNEAGITAADWSVTELEGLIAPVRSLAPGVLCAISAHSGTEDRGILNEYTPSWMRFCYYHSFRGGHLHDKYRHHFSFMRHEDGQDPVRRLAWSGEPTGPGPRVSATDNRHELEQVPGAVSALHVQTALVRTLPCYMSSPGVIYDQPFTDMAGFWETPRAVSRLPQDVQSWSLTHGGTPEAVFLATTVGGFGVVRADQAHGPDGQIASTFYSEHGQQNTGIPVPIRGAVEGTVYDGLGREVAAGRYSGSIQVPAYPLAYFVGRRV